MKYTLKVLTRNRNANLADEQVFYYDREVCVGCIFEPKNCRPYTARLVNGDGRPITLGEKYKTRDTAERAMERAYMKLKYAKLAKQLTKLHNRRNGR
jgi:hypothetical protein